MAIKKAKIISITSVKGGVGKTTLTLMLAGILENKKYKTLVVDLDLYASGISLALNLESENDIYKLSDDIRNNRYDMIENYVVNYSEYIDVLLSPKDPRYASKIGAKYIEMILDKASTRYDIILIDTSHLLIDTNLVAFDSSDQLIYLITNDLYDLKNMRTMVSIFSDMEKDNYTVVLNKAINKHANYSDYEIKYMIDSDIDYIIHDDIYIKNISDYILNGKILTLDNKINKKAVKTIKQLENMLNKILEVR